jgi:hypothetical protein
MTEDREDMKPVMNVMMVGMLLSCAACLSQDPGDPSAAGLVDEENTAVTESALQPFLGPDFYITCSDDPNVCSPGYGSVSIVPDASCLSFGSSHLVTCRRGAVSL